jgi:RNA polymerase sigma-70 factor (ECF subfamily)
MSQPCNYNEVEAVKLLVSGNEKGFQQIYDRYALNVFRVGMKYLRSTELAEDLVQEVFSALWVQRDQFEKVEFFQRYLFTMCRNIAFRHLKTIVNRELGEKEYTKLKRYDDNNVEYHLLGKECVTIMQHAVKKLPVTHRRVYELVTNEGLSHRAVAEQLNVSVQTVSNSMALALKSIKQHLTQNTVTGLILAFNLI